MAFLAARNVVNRGGCQILVVNVIEEGRLGGPQVRIAEVARLLKKLKVETVVVMPSKESGAFQLRLDNYGVTYKTLPIHKLSRSGVAALRYLIGFPFEIFLLYRLFRHMRPDLVHCSGGAWQYKGVIAGKLAGAKTVWHLNDTSLSGFFKRLFRLVEARFADAVIVAAHRVREYYADVLPPDRLVFEIQAPVDTQRFMPMVKHDSLSWENRIVRLVSVANLNPLKGVEYLVLAIGILCQRGYKVELSIIGASFASQASYHARVQHLAEKVGEGVVTFLGSLGDVRPALSAADIYVCSSIKEASPLSVWEAMSMAMPIVSTDVGDVARFVIDGESGRIVPPADAEALAGAIALMIDNQSLALEYGSRAREVAIRKLDIVNVAEKHRQCYQAVLNNA